MMPPLVDQRAPAATRSSWLDRSLSLITEVRAGEGASALLLAANVFFLLTFYSVLKVVRESLILSEGGAEIKSYSAAGQALLLLAIVPAYGAFASRVNRLRLVCGVTLFFASHLLVFYFLGAAGVHVGVAFFLWIGIFNLVVIAQFWAFANDLYSAERGKRLFPLIGLGASLGAVAGAEIASIAFSTAGPYTLMLVAACGLGASVVLTLWVNSRERAAGRDQSAHLADRPLGKAGGFHLVLTNRYLLLIALLMVVLNVVNTLGEFLMGKLIVAEAARTVALGAAGGAGTKEVIGHLAGGVQASVNLLGFLLQAFLVSRIFKYIGVRGALFILPLIALFGYTMIAFVPVFSIVRLVKIFENGTDYSIQNTARQALFLPTSREAKYKAKQAIDSFFWRAGDVLQAGVVFLGTELALGVSQFALVNIALVAVWLAIVVALFREHKKLTAVDTGAEAAA
jgi:ATP:ADP antiporter, AAA family